jgi:hypothetical protein
MCTFAAFSDVAFRSSPVSKEKLGNYTSNFFTGVKFTGEVLPVLMHSYNTALDVSKTNTERRQELANRYWLGLMKCRILPWQILYYPEGSKGYCKEGTKTTWAGMERLDAHGYIDEQMVFLSDGGSSMKAKGGFKYFEEWVKEQLVLPSCVHGCISGCDHGLHGPAKIRFYEKFLSRLRKWGHTYWELGTDPHGVLRAFYLMKCLQKVSAAALQKRIRKNLFLGQREISAEKIQRLVGVRDSTHVAHHAYCLRLYEEKYGNSSSISFARTKKTLKGDYKYWTPADSALDGIKHL